jgi:hypothetical protein
MRIDAQSWLFFPVREGVVEKHNMEVLLADGKKVPSQALQATTSAALQKWVETHPEPVEKKTILLKIGAPGMVLRNRDTASNNSDQIRNVGIDLLPSARRRTIAVLSVR